MKNIRKIVANKILGILTRINFPFSGEWIMPTAGIQSPYRSRRYFRSCGRTRASFQRKIPREIKLFKGWRVRERVQPFERHSVIFTIERQGKKRARFERDFADILAIRVGNNCVGNRYLNDFWRILSLVESLLIVIYLFIRFFHKHVVAEDSKISTVFKWFFFFKLHQ